MQAWCVLDNQHFNACKTATNNASGNAVLQISGLSNGVECSAALSENYSCLAARLQGACFELAFPSSQVTLNKCAREIQSRTTGQRFEIFVVLIIVRSTGWSRYYD